MRFVSFLLFVSINVFAEPISPFVGGWLGTDSTLMVERLQDHYRVSLFYLFRPDSIKTTAHDDYESQALVSNSGVVVLQMLSDGSAVSFIRGKREIFWRRGALKNIRY